MERAELPSRVVDRWMLLPLQCAWVTKSGGAEPRHGKLDTPNESRRTMEDAHYGRRLSFAQLILTHIPDQILQNSRRDLGHGDGRTG